MTTRSEGTVPDASVVVLVQAMIIDAVDTGARHCAGRPVYVRGVTRSSLIRGLRS